jgi:hypothetical protein
MAKLNFPDPTLTQIYEEAGIVWTWNDTLKVWSSEAGEIPDGGDASVDVGDTRPSLPSQGDLWFCTAEREDGGGRLYVYYEDADSGQWVDVSQPGGGFSGDYNDLTNKPNIPPEFNLDDGSVTNSIIHWAELGSVQEISTTETAFTTSGASFSDIAASGGNGTGLVCNVIRRKNTGAHEVYVAVRGEGYNAGETISLDLGYDPANPNGTGSTGINCTIDQVNETVDGWVARPGEDYFVSSTNDSVNTGMPQFMSGLVTGGDTNSLANADGEATLNIFPIGDKGNVQVTGTGTNYKFVFRSPDSSSAAGVQHELADADGNTRSQVWQLDSTFEFSDRSADSKNLMFETKRNSDGVGQLTIFKDHVSNSKNYLRFTPLAITSATNAGNNALNFGSSNGKYNFKKADGTTNGYVINAEGGNAGFVLPEDAALASNYDAEGEYIGPIQDRVADLIARVSAIESNEVADDAVDSALLTLVASLSQRLDERDQQIDALTSRIAALEGA